MTLQTIPLSKLVPSAANVRKTGGTSIEDLAASIASSGLLNNLVVRALLGDDGSPTDKYEVVAGGRRLAALKRLAKEKRVARNMAVPCNILEDGNATEISLAENVVREAMHPADQFEAFAALAGQGLGAEEIAARFGTSDAHVKKLLRLASVSPSLIAVYREGEMTLEQLMAFSVSADHDAQERVWSEQLETSPTSIRRALTEAWVDTTHRLVRFVGLDAYEAAGGGIERDLFQERHEGYLTDRALLERLVNEKLEAICDELRGEGWQWVEVIPDFHYASMHGMSQISPEKVALSDADAEEQEALATEYDALAQEDVEVEAISERLEAIDERLAELSAKSAIWTDGLKATAGVVVSIKHNGVMIERGLVRNAAVSETANDNEATDRKPRPAIPSSLVRDLSAQRTAALRVMLAGQPEVALDALLYTLALPVFYEHEGLSSCLEIDAEHRSLKMDAPGIEESLAEGCIEEQRQAWQRVLPEAGEFWSWLGSQPQDRKLSLLAFCTALTLSAIQKQENAPRTEAGIDHANALHLATGLDMAEWWQPTRLSFLGRVSKDQIVGAVRDACGIQIADTLVREKRDWMIDRAERKLAGKGWLPALLRAPVTSDSIPAEEEPLSAAA